MSLRLAAAAALAVTFNAAPGAAQPAPAAHVIGTWRGTSLCTVKPSACNDEHVVYRVTHLPALDSVTVDARKIVQGAEEAMGVLRCRVAFASARAVVTCTMPNGVWHFEVRGDSLVGELRLPNDTKYRDVRTARARS